MAKKASVAKVGPGAIARFYLQETLKQTETTTITVVCEPSTACSKIFVWWNRD
jgi:ornithine cyclodeaminase/alanine dehydrogenase-like protein (mu-crystallin family)